ncbi:MAG: hypothetical protein A3F67_04335 [Verrucomicrobia bacterium RIFCSPHIGHO2_12_FULL_41_10]|nr:MAG: hypothetical protein A3F67_04335 [Verrucomicrobia bacterium RIFCSPHIGHO2_12_FULL_41_10]HLB34819.1 hypothetical protein [Chthoniobacterales bacterium]
MKHKESIQIKKRGRLIALLTGVQSSELTNHKKVKLAKPDFAARRKALWKGRVFTSQEVATFRNDELEGEDR